MMNKTKTQIALGSARYELGEAIERVKELRVKIKNLRLDAAAERALDRYVRANELEARKIARAQKRAERIAALETKLANMRLKAMSPKQTRKNYRKASDVKVWSADEIAAFEATRHG